MNSNLIRRRLLQAGALGAGTSLFGIPMQVLAQKAKGGLIVIGTTQKPRHLNSAVQSGIATMMPAAQLFAFPLLMNSKWEPQPYLAESWEMSDDSRSIRLKLRENATFHDGRPITAEDLQFSIETIRENHPFKAMMGPVNAVTTEGKHIAVIRLSQPHPALPLALSTSFAAVIPKHVFGDGQDIKRHPRNANPVGSGPFKLVEFKPGQHTIMERHEGFFMPDQPLLDRIIIKEYKDPASLMLALEKGEIDCNPELLDPRDIGRAKQASNINVQVGAAPAIGPLIWLAFNTADPKLSDKRVRQAINYALDKKFITDTLFGSVHKRATGPIANGSPFYTGKVEHYELNIEKAKSLLDAAGMKPDASGTRMKLTVDSIPGNPLMKAIQEYTKPALAKVGIDVEVRLSPDFPTWAKRVSGFAFEATVDSVWNWGDPVIGAHRTWDSSNIRKGVIWSNTQGYKNDRVDAIIAQAGTETNAATRKKLYQELQRIVVDDCPVAFLNEMTFHVGWNKRLSSPPDSIWGMMTPLSKMSVQG
ncbi:MAG: ABC transporter substrate-binding protein [Burkholderiaceae bacterium]